MSQEDTKTIVVTLAALTRVEYTETLTVPSTFDEDDLLALVDQRWDDVDGGEFQDDPHYWERGNCHAEEADLTEPGHNDSIRTVRKVDGQYLLS